MGPDPLAATPRSEDTERRARLIQSITASVGAWRKRLRRQRPARANGRRPAVQRPTRSGNGSRPAASRPVRYQRSVPAPDIDLPAAGEPGVLARMPRSRFLDIPSSNGAALRMRRMDFSARRMQALGRLLVWIVVLSGLLTANGLDRLLRRSTPARRAVHLRRAFERLGGTGVKIGQYLAMRLDILPWTYAVELSQMRDTMPPFPAAAAIAAVERRTGRPLGQTFARFDPEAVSSDSVAAVYQGILRNGQQVVVRVRRPGVGELFMADLQVFDWILLTIEFLTILRPGYTEPMRREFRAAVLELLDFVQEARFQDSFRRAARRSGKRFFTAPRVYFDYSNEEVIVQEFVSGMWLWELLAGLEQNDERVLRLARELNIDPARVARRLTWVSYWGWDANYFFHAAPHPENIIIGRDGRLTFLNFSSVGVIDPDQRAAMHQNMYCMARNDPLGMARATVALMEPLPPVDVLELTKELEGHNWQMLYALAASKRAIKWTDRSPALQWMGVFQVAGHYGITLSFQTVRLLRSMLLSDALAVRLLPSLNIVREYKRYARHRARRARQRIVRGFQRRLEKGFDRKGYIRLERVANMTEGLLTRLRHVLSIPTANYNSLVGKGSYAVFALVNFSLQAGLVTLAAFGLIMLVQGAGGSGWPPGLSTAEALLTNPWYQLALLLLFLINTRSVLFHLDDVDVRQS